MPIILRFLQTTMDGELELSVALRFLRLFNQIFQVCTCIFKLTAQDDTPDFMQATRCFLTVSKLNDLLRPSLPFSTHFFFSSFLPSLPALFPPSPSLHFSLPSLNLPVLPSSLPFFLFSFSLHFFLLPSLT